MDHILDDLLLVCAGHLFPHFVIAMVGNRCGILVSGDFGRLEYCTLYNTLFVYLSLRSERLLLRVIT